MEAATAGSSWREETNELWIKKVQGRFSSSATRRRCAEQRRASRKKSVRVSRLFFHPGRCSADWCYKCLGWVFLSGLNLSECNLRGMIKISEMLLDSIKLTIKIHQDSDLDILCLGYKGSWILAIKTVFFIIRKEQEQDYEELEKQLKEVFKERSTVLRELTKTSRELDGIKVNLQSLKNDEQSSKMDVQKLLELGQKQREEMKSLQEALQNQLKETSEKAEKHQATINFLKTEVERKSKMIRDLQNENKSLKNKLLSGSKLCGMHAEESKKIQAQLKELRYGKKDLLFKAQQLTELEQKLAVAKNELEKAALDRESQIKAMKETVQLCLTSVFRDQPPPLSLIPSNPSQMLHPPRTIASKIPDSRTKSKSQKSSPRNHESSQVQSTKEETRRTSVCGPQDEGSPCLVKHEEGPQRNLTAVSESATQKLQMSPCPECEVKIDPEKQPAGFDGTPAREEKIL